MASPADGSSAQEGSDQQNHVEDQGQEPQAEQESTEDAFDALPEATKTEIRALRRENQRLRKATKAPKASDSQSKDSDPLTGQAALVAKLAEALGIDMGAIPAQKAATAPDSSSELRLAKVEVAVYKAAGATGADPDALLDSRAFLREIEDLDPTDASFDKELREAVKAAVGQNPNLRAKTVSGLQRKPPGKSGGDLAGGRAPSNQEFTDPQQRLAAAYAANNP